MEAYAYDLNGNITTNPLYATGKNPNGLGLIRNGNSVNGLNMDQLTYNYPPLV
jgi:hypothetical protein